MTGVGITELTPFLDVKGNGGEGKVDVRQMLHRV